MAHPYCFCLRGHVSGRLQHERKSAGSYDDPSPFSLQAQLRFLVPIWWSLKLDAFDSLSLTNREHKTTVNKKYVLLSSNGNWPFSKRIVDSQYAYIHTFSKYHTTFTPLSALLYTPILRFHCNIRRPNTIQHLGLSRFEVQRHRPRKVLLVVRLIRLDLANIRSCTVFFVYHQTYLNEPFLRFWPVQGLQSVKFFIILATTHQFSTHVMVPGFSGSWYTSKKVHSGSAMTCSYTGLNASQNVGSFAGSM